MDRAGGSIREIGSEAYLQALAREAAYWEDVASGAQDLSVAPWRDSALGAATGGDLLNRVLKLVVARGPRVLELACGGGGLSLGLARRGCICEGVDISPGLVEIGRREAAALQARGEFSGSAHFMVGDLNRLTFAPETYDVVLAHAALHHVVDLDHLLDQILRGLKPGGSLICLDHVEPSRAALLVRYALLLILPTEVPYHRKPIHIVKRVMARVYRRFLPRRQAPAAFTLPPSSPFEDVSGSEAIAGIARRFQIERNQTYLAFADVVAGHLRLGAKAREVVAARALRLLDDWLIRHAGLRGQTYFLVARKPLD